MLSPHTIRESGEKNLGKSTAHIRSYDGSCGRWASWSKRRYEASHGNRKRVPAVALVSARRGRAGRTYLASILLSPLSWRQPGPDAPPAGGFNRVDTTTLYRPALSQTNLSLADNLRGDSWPTGADSCNLSRWRGGMALPLAERDDILSSIPYASWWRVRQLKYPSLWLTATIVARIAGCKTMVYPCDQVDFSGSEC